LLLVDKALWSAAQVVAQSIESLPANSFFTSLATLDTDPLEQDLNKLALGTVSPKHRHQEKRKISQDLLDAMG
jgi:hypothetical protein